MARNGIGNGAMTRRPQPNRWYPLKLGSTFEHSSEKKFCTMQSLEGSHEEGKDTDGVLLFNGDAFYIEILHQTFKSLKKKRSPGESSDLTGLKGSAIAEVHSPPLKVARTQAVNRPSVHAFLVEDEKIDIGGPETGAVTKPVTNKANTMHQSTKHILFSPFSPDTRMYNHAQDEDDDVCVDILGDDEPGTPHRLASTQHTSSAVGFNINVPNQHAESNDEIDRFDDMPAENGGMSAAEALHAQMIKSGTGDVQSEQGGQGQEMSSSGGESSSSGSSNASGSGSSSSDSEESNVDDGDANSAGSAADIDIS